MVIKLEELISVSLNLTLKYHLFSNYITLQGIKLKVSNMNLWLPNQRANEAKAM
jgi:hypothetical protein